MGRHPRLEPQPKAAKHAPAASKHNSAAPFPSAHANSNKPQLNQDLSPCHATEEALRRSEERFRLLFEQAVDGIFVADAGGHYTDVNTAGCEMLGYTREEILSRSIADIVAPEERKRIAPHVAEFGGSKVTRSEWRFVRKDGSVFVGEVVARQLPDGRLQAILRDISERRRAEQALRESERRYRNLFESMDQGCCILQVLFDASGRPRDCRFLEINPAFERHSGLTQATGKTLLELAPDIEYRWCQIYGKVASTGESVRLQEFSPRLKRWFDLYAARVGEPGENKVAVLFYDITGRVQAEEALRRSQAELQEAQRVAHVGSWYWDAATDLTLGSDEMLRILGLEPGRDTLPRFGEQRGSYYPEEDWERIRAASYRALETGAGYELEARAYRNGSEIWIIHHGEAVRDEHGNITGLRGTVQDVTARKLAELELHQAQEQLRTVLRATGVGLWLHEPSSGRISWDARTRELLFVPPGEGPSMELFWSRVHPEDREPVRLEAEAALREDRLYSKDLRILDPESRRFRWIHAEGRWVRAQDGTAVRLDGINYDITERQQFQAELERLVAERTARLQELVGDWNIFRTPLHTT
jgi:PAS domain S-box-containing protein